MYGHIMRLNHVIGEFANTHSREQLHRNTGRDDDAIFLARDAIEVGQAGAGDDSASKRCAFDQQGLGTASRGSERGRKSGTAGATDQYIGFGGYGHDTRNDNSPGG